jgi:hypothetical protein
MSKIRGEKGEFDTGYRAMAQDAKRETEAFEFSEATIGDVGDATR